MSHRHLREIPLLRCRRGRQLYRRRPTHHNIRSTNCTRLRGERLIGNLLDCRVWACRIIQRWRRRGLLRRIQIIALPHSLKYPCRMKLRIFNLLCDLAIRRSIVKGLGDLQEHCGRLEGLGSFPTPLSDGDQERGNAATNSVARPASTALLPVSKIRNAKFSTYARATISSSSLSSPFNASFLYPPPTVSAYSRHLHR